MFRVLLALAAIAFLAMPARAEDLTPRARGDLAIRARAILKKHCYECHGAAESRGAIAVLQHPKLVATGPHPVPFVAPKNAAGSQIIQFLEDGSMPPGDRPRPSEDEIQVLKEWIESAAPGFPAAFDENATLSALLRDVQTRPADAPYLRYASLAHLIGEDTDFARLKIAEANLLESLAHCGMKPPPGRLAAEPVDDAATLYRFDVRQAGWERGDLFFRSDPKGQKDIYSLTPYDLILLEYPAPTAPAMDEKHRAALADYIAKARLARPVPYLRADWLGDQLAARTPLAGDVRGLNDLAAALKSENWPALGKEAKMPCGPRPRAFGGGNPVAAGAVGQPLSSWYSGESRAEQPPFKLEVRAVKPGTGEAAASVARKQPFELEVTTDRDVHFTLLMVWSNGEVVVQETNGKGFLKAGKTTLQSESNKPFSIVDILTGEDKATEYFVLFASIDPLPAPVVVRSRHANKPACEESVQYPLHRFLFPNDPKFDPSQVVRRVVAVTVNEK